MPKYVIGTTKKGSEAVAIGYFTHREMARTAGIEEVLSAGHCDIDDDGTVVRVYGESYGFGIESKESDKKILQEFLSKKSA